MIDVCLLGTGGMMPLPYRWLTSLYTRYNGKVYLIDCGEGTQIAMKEAGLTSKPIDVICFTHYHADHISGLPGMLLSMANAERTEPVDMIGPKGLERVVTALRTIAPELPFEIRFHELKESEERFCFGDLTIEAFRVKHNMVCYGYSMHLSRKGRFNPQAAETAGIPKPMWGRLQKGETIEADGQIYTPDMVMGTPRKGLSLTYCTDTRPVEAIKTHAEKADLFICEGMYGEKEKLTKAKQNRHMMMVEAAQLAKEADAQELWLTHYSPSLNYPENYMEEVRAIFPNAYAAKDGRKITLRFEDEEQ
jgi:ribonuclease Z